MLAPGRADTNGRLKPTMPGKRILTLLLSCIALVGLTGCAVSKISVPYGVETGHTLPATDYAQLQKVADALPGDLVYYRTKEQPPPLQFMPLVRYAYTFRPSVDVTKLNDIVIGPFGGDAGEVAKTAADLPAKLAERLTNDGFSARVGPTNTPDAYVLSGTVTKAYTYEGGIDAATGTQAEATLSRNSMVLGTMQVNAFVPATTSISPVVQLIALAVRDSRAWAVSRLIGEALRRAKSGQREAAANGYGMVTSAPAGFQYRQAPDP